MSCLVYPIKVPQEVALSNLPSVDLLSLFETESCSNPELNQHESDKKSSRKSAIMEEAIIYPISKSDLASFQLAVQKLRVDKFMSSEWTRKGQRMIEVYIPYL
jgi:hypothetical protein